MIHLEVVVAKLALFLLKEVLFDLCEVRLHLGESVEKVFDFTTFDGGLARGGGVFAVRGAYVLFISIYTFLNPFFKIFYYVLVEFVWIMRSDLHMHSSNVGLAEFFTQSLLKDFSHDLPTSLRKVHLDVLHQLLAILILIFLEAIEGWISIL